MSTPETEIGVFHVVKINNVKAIVKHFGNVLALFPKTSHSHLSCKYEATVQPKAG